MKYRITIDETPFLGVESELDSLDIITENETNFHILEDGKSFHAELIKQEGKRIELKINNTPFHIDIEDEVDILVKEMGMSLITTKKLSSVPAPMPGLILDIMVKPGQDINTGDPLVILEAMKMENVLKATGEGIVKSIEVNIKDSVEKGQVLIEME